jgi:hypothetical protein
MESTLTVQFVFKQAGYEMGGMNPDPEYKPIQENYARDWVYGTASGVFLRLDQPRTRIKTSKTD